MAKHKLSQLPKMDRLLAREELAGCGLPYPLVRRAARQALEEARQGLLAGSRDRTPTEAETAARTLALARALSRPGLVRVINATGVPLHTNLGRSPLSPRAAQAVQEAAAGYCCLEYDLASGRRGSRTDRVEELLRALTEAEGACVVNNNAAAVLLMLSVLTPGLGVAISRGELVEIGGAFRVPDIMARSGGPAGGGGHHQQNPPVRLRRRPRFRRGPGPAEGPPQQFQGSGLHPLYVYLLAGGAGPAEKCTPAVRSGQRRPLRRRFPGEPTVEEAVRWADVVCFSGDKLLGGPQAGILLGRAAPMARLKSDPWCGPSGRTS